MGAIRDNLHLFESVLRYKDGIRRVQMAPICPSRLSLVSDLKAHTTLSSLGSSTLPHISVRPFSAAGYLIQSTTISDVVELSSSPPSSVFSRSLAPRSVKHGKNSSSAVFFSDSEWGSRVLPFRFTLLRILPLLFVVLWLCPGNCGLLLVSSWELAPTLQWLT